MPITYRFKENSFDLVVGHSVLHHFIDYDQIIHRLGKLLRPGGMAAFYEPVLQGKILIAFMADLMLRTNNNTGWDILNEKEKSRIQRMTRHIMKAKWIGDQRDRLEQIEDKIFSISMPCADWHSKPDFHAWNTATCRCRKKATNISSISIC